MAASRVVTVTVEDWLGRRILVDYLGESPALVAGSGLERKSRPEDRATAKGAQGCNRLPNRTRVEDRRTSTQARRRASDIQQT